MFGRSRVVAVSKPRLFIAPLCGARVPFGDVGDGAASWLAVTTRRGSGAVSG